MSKTHYKLTYFDLTGRAEVSRQLFAEAGVEFEDNCIKDSEWSSLKPSTPFGQVPILEYDGKVLCQSNAIARYIANKFGLAGKTADDKAVADMIVDCIEDMIQLILPAFREKDSEKKKVLLEKIVKEDLATPFANLQKLLIANHNGDGYFAGDSFTWADLSFAVVCSWLDDLEVGWALDKYPKLAALKQRVNSRPRIADWIKSHPNSSIFHKNE